ncbi:MAG: outer membrane protein assembly factor BamD [Deltaproteobacteria bacterium]|nr:outer membrane protein assembly factor BamD [Deltaproteobacteria bacterium]
MIKPIPMSIPSSGFKGVILALFFSSVLLAGCSSKVVKKEEPVGAEVSFQKGMASYEQGAYEEAEASFKAVMEDYPLDSYAVDAILMLADTYYADEKYDDASAYYTTFYTFHPAHPKAPYALFQKGMGHLKEVLSVDRDQAQTRKALFAFEDLTRNYPESAYSRKAEELMIFLKKRLAERELYVGEFYFKTKNFKGALLRFAFILKDYPDTGLADKALYYIGESYTRLGEKDLAKGAFSTLITEFPKSPFVNSAKYRLNEG